MYLQDDQTAWVHSSGYRVGAEYTALAITNLLVILKNTMKKIVLVKARTTSFQNNYFRKADLGLEATVSCNEL